MTNGSIKEREQMIWNMMCNIQKEIARTNNRVDPEDLFMPFVSHGSSKLKTKEYFWLAVYRLKMDVAEYGYSGKLGFTVHPD